MTFARIALCITAASLLFAMVGCSTTANGTSGVAIVDGLTGMDAGTFTLKVPTAAAPNPALAIAATGVATVTVVFSGPVDDSTVVDGDTVIVRPVLSYVLDDDPTTAAVDEHGTIVAPAALAAGDVVHHAILGDAIDGNVGTGATENDATIVWTAVGLLGAGTDVEVELVGGFAGTADANTIRGFSATTSERDVFDGYPDILSDDTDDLIVQDGNGATNTVEVLGLP